MSNIADTEVRADTIDVFDAIANYRRRLVFELLHEEDVETLGGLATRIAARENDIPLEQVAGKQRTRVHIALYQTHLPKLDSAGFIEYDEDRGTVYPMPWTRGVLPLIDELEQLDEAREYEPNEEGSPGIGLLGGYRLSVSKEGDV